MNELTIIKRDDEVKLVNHRAKHWESYRKQKESEGWVVIRKVKVPSIDKMEKWTFDGISQAVDGCRVEPDGECIHGMPSWLLVMGII